MTYAYGAVAGTDKATIIKLRQRIAYLETALTEALTCTTSGLTHPKPSPTRYPRRREVPLWNRIDWTSAEAQKSIHDAWLAVHHANREPRGTGVARLATLGHETEAHTLETRLRNHTNRSAA
jgi:hypothetical protein